MPIPLRVDFEASQMRAAARQSKDGSQAWRLLALVAVYDGASRTEAARIGGVTLQIVRDWVIRFNMQGPGGLIDRKAPGQVSRLNDTHRVALATVIESGPVPAVHGVVRWRIIDLCQWNLGRVPDYHRRANTRPRAARDEVSQAVGVSAPPCASRGRN